MACDGLVQQTGKYRSIRHTKYPKFQTGIFGRMESAPCLLCKVILPGARPLRFPSIFRSFRQENRIVVFFY